jgi:hypothetical protein
MNPEHRNPMPNKTDNEHTPSNPASPASAQPLPQTEPSASVRPPEFGGPSGLEPTRYGDWERKGRCVDF